MVKASDGSRPVVIVTGAGIGLGRAYALHLAALGWRVVVNNRLRAGPDGTPLPSSAEAVVAGIRAAGGEAIAHHDDVCAAGAGERLLQAALGAWGRLDALVNNAGVDQHMPFHRIGLEDFRRIMAVNFDGTVAVTHPVYRHMRERGSGRIVVSVSSAGLHGLHGLTAYAASKGALLAFMRSLAAEGAPRDVHCAAIAPYAATRMTDPHLTDELRATMAPEAVAPMVASMVAPGSRLNGQTWVVGAGWARRASAVEWGTGVPVSALAAGPEAVASGPPREFDDALAAHADFLASARQGLRGARRGE
ncbi:MAG: SDR family NAD(P)-dependent oxidoreductase [Gammaproteobacteria bacterium]|nr:SDR family NAD(P)-dependent oxidoreductase [Gammaproteobacteria bacterium]